jgi:hypothetical protein
MYHVFAYIIHIDLITQEVLGEVARRVVLPFLSVASILTSKRSTKYLFSNTLTN